MSESANSGEIEQLEKFAIGLFLHASDPRISKPRLFLGKIPENFPFDIPIPEQSQVLGTLARSEMHVEIVLTSNLTPEEIAGFYRTKLTSQGWQEMEEMGLHQSGGFLHSSFDPNMNITFCQEPDGAGLVVNTVPLGDATTNIRLNLTLDREMNPCVQRTRMRRHMQHRELYRIIPSLAPPAGAQQRGGGGGSGTDEAHTTATLTSNLALDVLSKHYADQLSKAGWTQTELGSDGPIAWHTWRFVSEDQEPWTGLFFVLKTPDKPDDYFLFVRTTLDTPTGGPRLTSGWLGSTTVMRNSDR